jgi:hypothetical protein
VGAVRSFEGGCQAHACGRGEQAGNLAVPLAAEVVHLVEDDELEAVAQLLCAEVRRVVRRDGHVLDSLLAAAEPTDRTGELPVEFGFPLVEEIDCRNHYERRNTQRRHRGEPDDGLAAPCREFQHAPAASGLPGRQRV